MQFADFLATSPPGSKDFVADVSTATDLDPGIVAPDLLQDCTSKQCDGFRVFCCISGHGRALCFKEDNLVFLQYQCRNCRETHKTFALIVSGITTLQTYGHVLKLGEFPPFGPRVPARVITLIGPDRELFLKGRQAENHGLGIGAFAYYRRIITNQKDRIFDEVIRAAKKLGAPEDQIQRLATAKKETQFARSIEAMKGGFPPALLINGQNPLSLLFGPLSEGLHERTDEECLALATSIREVIFEMAERVGEVLKDKANLDTAVSQLMQFKKSS